MQRKSIWGATIAALTAGLALTGAPAAQAATVTDAVSNVQIVETTVARYAKTTVRFDWAVPDGTQPGDTFTIELPTIFSNTTAYTFDLPDKDGVTVAKAAVASPVSSDTDCR